MPTLPLLILAVTTIASADPEPPPTLEVGTPAAQGAVDQLRVRGVVQRASRALRDCYARGLQKAPALRGTTVANFTISGDGSVTASTATALEPAVDACISAVIAKLAFAKPTDGKPAQLTVRLTFAPGAEALGIQGNQVGAPVGGLGIISHSGAGGGSDTSTRIGPGYGVSSAPSGITIGQVIVKGDLDSAIVRRYIRRAQQKLLYCYEKQLVVKPTLRGTVTVEWVIGPDGRVATATARGLKNAEVESCIASVIQGVEFPKPTSEVKVECPLTLRPPPPPSDAPARRKGSTSRG